MKLLSSMSIRNKILIIPGLAVFGFAMIVVYTVSGISNNSRDFQAIENVYFPVLELSNVNIVSVERINETLTSAATTGDEDALKNVEMMKVAVEKRLDEKLALQPLREKEIQQLKLDLDTYYQQAFSLTKSMVDGSADFANIAAVVTRKNESYEAALSGFKKFRADSLKQFTSTIDDASKNGDRLVQLSIAVGVITALVLLAVAIQITYMVTRSLAQVKESLVNIAEGEGDLTQRITKTSNDEVGELVEWFNLFIEKLQATIGGVVSTIKPLTDMSKQLNKASTESFDVASEQKDSSGRMIKTMSELLEGVVNIADNAASASKGAESADDEVKTGMEVVGKTVNSINELAVQVDNAAVVIGKLESDVESVSGILDVIRSIAEQTNLLALNAAIEAARAGEQGRGFAVVADEVRTLASRTQDSTLEIQQLIERLQNAAQKAVSVMAMGKDLASSSVENAGKAGETLSGIAAQVSSIRTMNGQIADTTEQQQALTATIGDSVEEMQRSCDTASEGNQRVLELSGSLQSTALKLEEVSTQFKV